LQLAIALTGNYTFFTSSPSRSRSAPSTTPLGVPVRQVRQVRRFAGSHASLSLPGILAPVLTPRPRR